MDSLYRYLNVSCSLSRMLVMAAVVFGAGLLTGYGALWSFGFGVASLVAMQIAYFVIVVAMAYRERGD